MIFGVSGVLTVHFEYEQSANDIEDALANIPLDSEIEEVFIIHKGRKIKLKLAGVSFAATEIESI
jgi:hypothetical protein